VVLCGGAESTVQCRRAGFTQAAYGLVRPLAARGAVAGRARRRHPESL